MENILSDIQKKIYIFTDDILSIVERDKTHGIKHARDVFLNAMENFEKNGLDDMKKRNIPFDDKTRDIIGVCALLHDVCDHKYETKEYKCLEYPMKTVIKLNFDDKCANSILKIIRNVSYSREARGEMEDMTDYEMYCRDVVSDADKLEAIGVDGIQRCWDYQLEIANDLNMKMTDTEVLLKVEQHIDEKLIKLYPSFIRTKGGKEVATNHHDFLEKWRHQKSKNKVKLLRMF